MNTFITVLIIVLVVAAIALFFLYRAGMKMQTEQAQNQLMLDKYAQVASLLIIDKKRMPFKEAPLPKEISAPVYTLPGAIALNCSSISGVT